MKSTRERGELDKRAEIRIPVSQVAMQAPALDAFYDAAFEPMRSRIRELVDEQKLNANTLIPMATMVRAADGGPLRTFAGNLPHENGWLSILKANRLLHWQGVAQRALLIRSASDFRWTLCETENLRLEFSDGFDHYRYTNDVTLTRSNGSKVVIEVKRDERDLEDVRVRRKLALAAEIYRRCGLEFYVAFRDEIFESRHHRRNAELFASRSFLRVEPKHIRRLEAHAMTLGSTSTYGALASALEPENSVHGKALVQALTCRRRVEMNITQPLHSGSELIIH